MSISATHSEAIQRKRRRRQRRWIKRLALTGMLAGFAAGGWAFDATQANSGLKGILPAQAPDTLTADAFTELGPNWENWSQQTIADIEKWYAMEGSEEDQAAALANVKRRLKTLDRAIADPKYRMIVEPLLSIRGPLNRRVTLAEAAVATLNADPEVARERAVKASSETLEKAVAELKSMLNGVPGGPAWLPYIKADALDSSWRSSKEDAATVAALKATAERLGRRTSLNDTEQKAFLNRPEFVRLEKAIQGHLAIVGNDQKVDVNQTRQALTNLFAALEDYEYTNSEVAAADVLAAVEQISGVAPDGGARIRDVIDSLYFQNNLQLTASETFLNRLLSDSRIEQGRVNDFILGAAVGGWQTTSTHVNVDLKPSSDRILFDLVLNGVVQSSTAGRTDQATIYTSGYHTFRSSKEVAYDGTKFTTGPAYTSVNPHNTTTGATTRLSGAPIFGAVAQRIAIREATARRPQSEAIAASRVSSNVTPKFNAEVDKAFREASQDLENDLYRGLKETGLYPDQQSYSSTSSSMSIVTRLMGEGKLGGSAIAPTLLASNDGASMLMHESVINNSIDKMGFNDKKMSEEELRAHIEAFLSKALARDVKLQSPEAAAAKPEEAAAAEEQDKEPAQLVFTKYDPIRVQFRSGELLLIIRAGLERQNNDPIPAHEIVVPLTFTVDGDQIHITRGTLSVLPIEGDPMPIQQRVMNNRIASALPDRDVSGKFKLRGPNREVNAVVTDIKVVDGWIGVHVK